ncbi:MAG: insulinase family protein [Pseudomonadota bacterium]|nr:MAG: insulinase family protein [Pseudomonadota bacterium]
MTRRKGLRSLRLRAALLLVCVLPGAHGTEYTPENLYDAHYAHLANGLDVFLKPQRDVHNVAIRLVVHVGVYDFDCGKTETAHFLEHLLFTGTSQHSEAELDALIEDNGGTWNASTGGEKTIYEIDIYSRYALQALDVLYEIMTDSQFKDEDIETTRDIVHREMGGKPSRMRQWLYRLGVGKEAEDKAAEYLWAPHYNCPEIESAAAITREDIINAAASWYVPNNMALIVVGDFDRDMLMQHIEDSFGQLSYRPLAERTDDARPAFDGPVEVSGTLAPILGTDAVVRVSFPVSGYLSPDIFQLLVLDEYLQVALFNDLRVQSGLSYAPASSLGFDRNAGVLSLSADVNLGNVEPTLRRLVAHVQRLHEQPLGQDAVDLARRRILLKYVQGYQANASIADHYAAMWRRFERDGQFTNLETALASVTADSVNALVASQLRLESAVLIRDVPALTYTQFYLGIALLTTGAGVLVWLVYRRIRRHRSKSRAVR